MNWLTPPRFSTRFSARYSPLFSSSFSPSFSLLLLCLLVGITPPAQAIYKCTLPGTVLYSDRPCNGEPVTIRAESSNKSDKSDYRPSSSSANDALAREKAEIARLQKSREQRDRQEQQIRDLYTRGAAARARKCSSLAQQLRWREEDLRDATLQTEQKARVRARRAAEKFRLECQ